MCWRTSRWLRLKQSCRLRAGCQSKLQGGQSADLELQHLTCSKRTCLLANQRQEGLFSRKSRARLPDCQLCAKLNRLNPYGIPQLDCQAASFTTAICETQSFPDKLGAYEAAAPAAPMATCSAQRSLSAVRQTCLSAPSTCAASCSPRAELLRPACTPQIRRPFAAMRQQAPVLSPRHAQLICRASVDGWWRDGEQHWTFVESSQELQKVVDNAPNLVLIGRWHLTRHLIGGRGLRTPRILKL